MPTKPKNEKARVFIRSVSHDGWRHDSCHVEQSDSGISILEMKIQMFLIIIIVAAVYSAVTE